MKKIIIFSFTLIMLISAISYGFMVPPPSVPSDCVRIYVNYSGGTKNTRDAISAKVCSGGSTKKFHLNDYGYADICYNTNSSLCAIYIDGAKYETESLYKKGKEYTIKMRK